ncbi:MAG: serine protease [Verrucomicrobiae bacterium]|nr:serine protease [Verrucomicrobiae bacterium]
MTSTLAPHAGKKARRPKGFVAAITLCACAPMAGAMDASPPPNSVDTIGQDVRRIHDANRDGLARVRALTPIGMLTGTGFFVDADGFLLTSSSLVASKDQLWIEAGGIKAKAEIVGVDRRSSVALLRSAARGMPLKLAAHGAKEGDAAIALGFQFDKETAPAFGLISGIDSTSPDGRYFCAAHIRADIGLTPGMMGGPLLDTRGEVIGLIIGTLGQATRCYALPVASVSRVADDLRQHGRRRLGWVGISIRQDTNALHEASCVFVRDVFTNAPAYAAGIRAGDRILKIGPRDVRQPGDIIEASFLARIGEQMPLVLQRGEERLSFEIPVHERPPPAPSGPAGPGFAEAEPPPGSLPGPEGAIHVHVIH